MLTHGVHSDKSGGNRQDLLNAFKSVLERRPKNYIRTLLHFSDMTAEWYFCASDASLKQFMSKGSVDPKSLDGENMAKQCEWYCHN